MRFSHETNLCYLNPIKLSFSFCMEVIVLPPLFYKTCSGKVSGLLKTKLLGIEDFFLLLVRSIFYMVLTHKQGFTAYSSKYTEWLHWYVSNGFDLILIHYFCIMYNNGRCQITSALLWKFNWFEALKTWGLEDWFFWVQVKYFCISIEEMILDYSTE